MSTDRANEEDVLDKYYGIFSSVQLLSRVWLSETPWTPACQASLSITNSQSPPKPMSIESLMPYNHLILCQPFSSHLQSFPAAVQFSSVVSDSLQPHEPQHTRPPCPSPAPGGYSNSCPLSWWCHPTILSSVIPFSSCLQSFPASESFQMIQLFTSGGQSIGVSASTSVLQMNTPDWSLGWTGWIFLQSKKLSRVFCNPTVQKHQFFGTRLSL